MRRLRLSATGAIIVRGLLSLTALLVSALSSLILARKLTPIDYAAYQSLTKRASWIAGIPVLLMGDWVYRYAAQKIPGTWEAFRTLAIITAAWSLVVGLASSLYVGIGGVELALLASATLTLVVLYTLYRAVASALRPVRFATVVLAYRTLYAILVLLLVYALGYGLAGAFSSVSIASLAALLVYEAQLAGVRPPGGNGSRVLREWLVGIRPQVIASAATLIASLDALVALKVAGSSVVAGFFAAGIVATLAREAAASGMGYISAALLSGATARFHAALEAAMLLVAPFIAVAAVYPNHIMSIINPGYSWASTAESVAAISAYITIYEAYTFNLASGIAKGTAREAAPVLEAIALRRLVINVGYIALLTAALYAAKSPGGAALLWTVLLAVSSAARAWAFTALLPAELRREALKPLATVVAGLAASLAAASAVKPLAPLPRRRFVEEVVAFTPHALLSLALAYTAMLLVPQARRRMTALARAVLRMLHSRS